ncbi:MAG: type IV pilus secretin PilQ [Xanthomonadales bacterium]|nr:type IV pilus secretin PilQ [Xanthomonadales bacterium]
MKSDKEWLSIEPQICNRGRSMRILRKGFLTGLGLICVTAPLATAFAATEVTGIDYDATSDGGVKITLATVGDIPEVSVFATEDPARIVLDLAKTTSSGGSDPVSVGAGAVQKFTVSAAGGRTRMVVDLDNPVDYDYAASDGRVVLTIAGSGGAVATPAVAATESMQRSNSGAGGYIIEGIDFRRGEAGQGRVILSMNKPGANMTIEDGADRITIDLMNVSLPDQLRQRLDVVDFATPVQMIDASNIDNGVRIRLTVAGAYEHLSYEADNTVVIEVKDLIDINQSASEEDASRLFEEKVYTETKVTFNFQDIPVRSVLQLIADVSDLNIVVADSVGGNLTLRLTNVPWDQALDMVMNARNLDKRENGNVLWIGPTQEIAAREQELLKAQQDKRILEPLVTVLIPMSYAKAEDMKALIETSGGSSNSGDSDAPGLLSERGSVAVDERTNTLLLTDTADQIVEIRQLLTKLDRAVRQVQIESRIVIANSEFVHELGVRFGVTYAHIGSNIFIVAGDGAATDVINPRINPRDDGLLDLPSFPNRYQVNLPATDPNASTIGFSFLSSNVILDLELSALEAEGEGEIISTPRVITANQAEAFIQQGVEIPYEEATSSGATSVQFKDAVLQLKVTPLITPDNRVQLDLNVKQDSVGEIFQTSRGGSVPSIDTREVQTKVLVANGDTVVLGGIFQDEKSSSTEKVPFLGDIPYVGALFRRRGNQNKKRELLIFVTPTIVEDRPIL